MKEYLNEDRLEVILSKLFPNDEIIRNKQIPNSGRRFRPDFRIESKKLIIEFDGYQHYTLSKNVFIDQEKDSLYKDLGYGVIRIPYFIQLDKEMIKFYFNISTYEPNYYYPHGFIDNKAVLPADFCELGIERFVLNCLNFPDAVSNKIGESINIKAKELGNIKKVIPVNMINYFTEKYDKVEV